MSKKNITITIIFLLLAAVAAGVFAVQNKKSREPSGVPDETNSNPAIEDPITTQPSVQALASESAVQNPPSPETPGSVEDDFEASWDVTGIENQPYLVAVNRALCTLTVFGKDDEDKYTVPVKAMACSVGKEGHETPLGRWNTTDRFEWCYMIDKSYGRYAIRIYKGWMFHSVCYFEKSTDTLEYEEFNKLGTAASLGCVRLCLADIKWLYDNCPGGFATVIYENPEIAGPLGKPETFKIDTSDEVKRGWDPTDEDPASPWNQ